jgi:hypothetical protein
LHISFDVLLSAGMLPSITVGAPVAHGAVVTGMQGMGVRTPMAADVAAATDGFARLEHMPNGMMFTIGLLSMMFAAGMLLVIIWLAGRTFRVLGATPKLH